MDPPLIIYFVVEHERGGSVAVQCCTGCVGGTKVKVPDEKLNIKKLEGGKFCVTPSFVVLSGAAEG